MSSPISQNDHPVNSPVGRVRLVTGAIMLLAAAGLSGQPPVTRPQFRWPVDTGTPPEIHGLTSTFGESRGDHFHNGLDIAAANRPVKTIAGGRILFSRMAADTPFDQPGGPGNVVVVEHENGWRSGYFHLATITRRSPEPTDSPVEIGRVGNTGRSRGIHLHFFVADPQGRFLNPLLVLPAAADPHAPLIGMAAVFTETSMALLSPVQEENIRLSKAFPVGVTIIDPGLEPGTRRGIFELSWQLNDGPVSTRRFETLQFRADALKLPGGEAFGDVFRKGRFLLGTIDFQNGANTLNVWAKDLAGNKSNRTYRINVNRQQ